ncbi:hypothetical protein HY375_02030 [Candidatus Berkelbacteria bacterium]|nr:hypothetical protein [Candidatus Berkelbacteria bacterium]
MLFLWLAAGLGAHGLSIVLETVLQRRPNAWGIRLAAAGAQLAALAITGLFFLIVGLMAVALPNSLRPDAPAWFYRDMLVMHVCLMIVLIMSAHGQTTRFWHLLSGDR